MTIHLTPQTVAIAKDILYSGFEGKHPAFKNCFEYSDTVTAKHILYEQYVKKTQTVIPKVFIYIVMDQAFGCPILKDEKGNLGYKLKISE